MLSLSLLYEELLSIVLHFCLFSSFFLSHFPPSCSLPASILTFLVFPSPFALFSPFHTLCLSDWRLQIATEFHHKSYPTLLLLPLLPSAKHTKICTRTRKLVLTCHQNPQLRVTINKFISETCKHFFAKKKNIY